MVMSRASRRRGRPQPAFRPSSRGSKGCLAFHLPVCCLPSAFYLPSIPPTRKASRRRTYCLRYCFSSIQPVLRYSISIFLAASGTRHQPGQLTGRRPDHYPASALSQRSRSGTAPGRAQYPLVPSRPHHRPRHRSRRRPPDPVLADAGLDPLPRASIPGTAHGSGMAYAGERVREARVPGEPSGRAGPFGAGLRGRALGAVPCHRALSRAGAGTVLTSATWWPIHHPATGRERASVRRRWWLMLARSAIRAQARSRSPGERQRDRPPEGRHGTGERSEKERSDCPVIWGL